VLKEISVIAMRCSASLTPVTVDVGGARLDDALVGQRPVDHGARVPKNGAVTEEPVRDAPASR
jgi:hypothetical protein